MLRLREKYNKEVVPAMMKKFGYKSIMAVPRIKRVVVNAGFGRLVSEKTSQEKKKILEDIFRDLALITGQKPIATKAKKSIAGFKLRQGSIIGAKTTLRKQKMYDFLDRLIHIALPRTRDFRGISLESIDKNGHLTIGIKEHIVFPELSDENIKRVFGFEVTVNTNSRTREEAVELFKLLGFPLENSKIKSQNAK